MGIGVSIFLIALGAILTFAVNTHPSGLNIHVVGVVLMCVGIFGILLSLIYWESWGRGGYGRGYAPPPPGDDPARAGWYARGYRPRRRVVEEEVVDEGPPPPGPPPGPPPP